MWTVLVHLHLSVRRKSKLSNEEQGSAQGSWVGSYLVGDRMAISYW